MNVSVKLRIAALVGSIGTTFALVYLLAGYGYPELPTKALVAVSVGR